MSKWKVWDMELTGPDILKMARPMMAGPKMAGLKMAWPDRGHKCK